MSEYDLVVVGFGAGALGFACALADREDKPFETYRILFLEKQHEFGWHDGMLLPHSLMQINFIKDLATLRDPRSRFTFLNFLREQSIERLLQFSNIASFEPSRSEFKQYLSWAAKHFDEYVRYCSNVVNLKQENGVIEVSCEDGSQFTCNKLLVATGNAPFVPDMFSHIPRELCVHSSSILHSVAALIDSANKSGYGIAVIGAGQSAAEIFCFLDHSLSPDIPVYLIGSNPALQPADSTNFTNEFFFPADSSKWFDMNPEIKQELLCIARPTNYGVVNNKKIKEMYNRLYLKNYIPEYSAKRELLMSRKIEGCEYVGDKIKLSLFNKITQSHDQLIVSALVTATGYKSVLLERELVNLKKEFIIKDGKLQLTCNYAAQLKTRGSKFNVWIIGYDEVQHGIGETLLSWNAIRSGHVADDIFPPPLAKPKV